MSSHSHQVLSQLLHTKDYFHITEQFGLYLHVCLDEIVLFIFYTSNSTEQVTQAYKHNFTSVTNFILKNEIPKLTFPTFEQDLVPSDKQQLIIGPQNKYSDWVLIVVSKIRSLNLTYLFFFV